MENYVYILKCGDGSLYTGWTNHLEERVAAHQAGRGAKYTEGRGPIELVYYETFRTKEEAMRREYAVKRLSRKDKLALVGQASALAERREPGSAEETASGITE